MFHIDKSAENPHFDGFLLHTIKTMDKVVRYGGNNQVDFFEHTEEELVEIKVQEEQEEKKRLEKQREREKAYREKRKAKKLAENGGEIVKTKVCPHCQKEFIPTSNRQIFCSKDCCYQARQDKTKADREAEKGNHYYRQRVCAVCGSTYWPTHSQQKLCSEECQKQNHNEKSLKFYHKKQKEKSKCNDLSQMKELVSSTNSWAAAKQAQRKEAYELIDNTCSEMVASGDSFRQYLDVQGRFDRYSVVNAILVSAQMPEATQLKEYSKWKANRVYVNKDAQKIIILEPSKEYTREDGTKGVSYNAKVVYDISETSAKDRQQEQEPKSMRELVSALIDASPVPCVPVGELELPAYYDSSQQTIFVKKGLSEEVLFVSMAKEVSAAVYDFKYNESRDASDFKSFCVAYMVSSRYGVDTRGFDFSRLPREYAEMDTQAFKGELGTMRDVLGEIQSDMYKSMLNFGKLYDIISDEEKKSLITYLIKEIQIYPNGESERPLKPIEFNFPIYRDGQEVRRLLWEKGNTVETVCLMSRKDK